MPRSRWYCASLSVGYDLVTASFSVADMVCDYLVLLQFYTDGRPVFFAPSLVVMLLAHATYACLFTQKYVPDHTTNQHGRIVAVFLAALPVSQFVPLFIYLESLDLPFMRRAMRKCGLRSDQGGGVDQQEGTDPFWVSMREKASAHSGFLAEAVAEAVPQCALQTVAAVLDGELRYLNLVSILLSIAVITSKCWVLSYSLHVPTMCFNAICGARDFGRAIRARNSGRAIRAQSWRNSAQFFGDAPPPPQSPPTSSRSSARCAGCSRPRSGWCPPTSRSASACSSTARCAARSSSSPRSPSGCSSAPSASSSSARSSTRSSASAASGSPNTTASPPSSGFARRSPSRTSPPSSPPPSSTSH